MTIIDVKAQRRLKSNQNSQDNSHAKQLGVVFSNFTDKPVIPCRDVYTDNDTASSCYFQAELYFESREWEQKGKR